MPSSRSYAMTSTRRIAVIGTLALAAAAWVVAIRQMQGMDMGTATELGSASFFLGAWAAMMAAMMLPGALPAIARVGARFAVSYLAVWTLLGLAVYAVYRPHSTAVAGTLVIAAGLYELTPLKRACRRRCRAEVRSGLEFGVYCVGSSAGLMVMLVALGVMSIAWMAIVAVLVAAQKLLPPRALLDVPVALAITTLGMVMLT